MKKSTILLALGTFVCLLVSLLAMFFVTFNVVFSDVGGPSERFGTYVYSGVSYFILGFICGVIGPSHLRRWVYILTIPAITILVVYTFSEPQNVLIHMGFAMLVPVASIAGTKAGARLRKKKVAPPVIGV